MVRKNLFITLFFMICIFGIEVKADFISVDGLDFGSITASQEVQKLAGYDLELPGQSVALELWLTSDITCKKSGLKLPLERLKIKNDDSFQSLGKQHISLWVKKSNDQQFPLVFSVTVLPEDQPGLYETTLVMKSTRGKLLARSVKITFEVKPWVLLKTEWGEIELADYQHSFTLSNQLPATLMVSSNVSWKLFGSCLGAELLSNRHLEFHLPNAEKIGLQSDPGNLFLTEEPALLATGQATTLLDSDWMAIPFLLKIPDYTSIRAGDFDFDLYFKVLPEWQSQSF